MVRNRGTQWASQHGGAKGSGALQDSLSYDTNTLCSRGKESAPNICLSALEKIHQHNEKEEQSMERGREAGRCKS